MNSNTSLIEIFHISGLGYALAISRWIWVLVVIGYLFVSGKYKYTLSTWSSQCFYDWGQYLRLALPAAAMLSLEMWSIEIITFVSGKEMLYNYY